MTRRVDAKIAKKVASRRKKQRLHYRQEEVMKSDRVGRARRGCGFADETKYEKLEGGRV
jgi:hypothetical protein